MGIKPQLIKKIIIKLLYYVISKYEYKTNC